MRFDLSDDEWAVLEPLMPKSRMYACADDRKSMNAIFYVLRTGMPWRDLPERYGPYTTAYNRFNRWSRRGIWKRIAHQIGLTLSQRKMSLLCRFSDAGNDGAIGALGRPASEKRQGRKSRSVVRGRCGWRYGDLAARSELRNLGWSGCGDGFAAQRGCGRRCERAVGALNDKIGSATTVESGAPLRAWVLPAESRPE